MPGAATSGRDAGGRDFLRSGSHAQMVSQLDRGVNWASTQIEQILENGAFPSMR